MIRDEGERRGDERERETRENKELAVGVRWGIAFTLKWCFHMRIKRSPLVLGGITN
jgi:hypothetical protein